jgi:hypothetical protein
MAMMITKFHKLIQSRLVWIVFLVVIVFAFVVWGMVMPKSGEASEEATSPGKLNGKYVSRDEFRNAYVHTYISLSMMLGQPIRITDEIDMQLQDAAWRRVVAMRKARKLGLTATDAEVIGAIKGHPAFQVNNRFSQVNYNRFIGETLAAMRISEVQFEEHVREEIAMQKLRQMITQGALISPFEINRTFSAVADTFDIEYASIYPQDVEDDVEVTEDDARDYFEANPEAFTIPPQVRVKYVRFPVDDFMTDVEIDEETIADYYDENIDQYTEVVYVTNSVTPDLADSTFTNVPQTEVVEESIITPLEDVRDELQALLKKNQARANAASHATEFVMELMPDRNGESRPFEDVVSEFDIDIYNPDPFSLQEPIAEVQSNLAFNAAAFRLEMDAADYVSDAVAAEDWVYVIALEEKLDARIPEFEEVAEEALEAARLEAATQALIDRAEALRQAAQEAIADGGSLTNTASEMGLEASVITNATALSELDFVDNADLIFRAALVRNQGELTEPIPAEGAMLLAYIRTREPADPAIFSQVKPQLVNSLRQERTRRLFNDWQTYLLEQADFTPRSEFAPVQEEVEEDEPAEEAPLEE